MRSQNWIPPLTNYQPYSCYSCIERYFVEVSITAKPTVSDGRAARPVDPQASLRTELIGQLAACQLAIEAVIAELNAKGMGPEQVAAMRSQLAGLGDMRRTVAIAGGRELASMRAEVAAAVASAAEMVSVARQGGTTQNAADADLTPQQRAHRILSEVSRDLFDRKVLDPYLRFASEEDKRAYRERERERKEQIDRAMALGTREGNRIALELVQEQLRDAKAHGADRAPEFHRMEQQADEATANLEPNAHLAIEQRAPQAGNVSAAQASDDLSDIASAMKAAGVTTKADHGIAFGHGVASAKTPDGKGLAFRG